MYSLLLIRGVLVGIYKQFICYVAFLFKKVRKIKKNFKNKNVTRIKKLKMCLHLWSKPRLFWVLEISSFLSDIAADRLYLRVTSSTTSLSVFHACVEVAGVVTCFR